MHSPLALALVSLLLASTSVLASPLPNPLPQDPSADTFVAPKATAWGDDGFTPKVLISYSAPLTYPTKGEVFNAGGPAYITWDGILPAPFTLDQVSSTARLILGYTSTTSPGLHLDLNNPLGLDIPIYVPPFRYDFVLPSNLTTRSTYIVSFQGSSGNISPVFTINGNDASPAPAPASSSSSSPSPKPKPAATPASSSDDSGGDAPGPSTTALSTQYLAPSPTSIGSGIADAQAATQPVVIANAGATTANMIPITPFSATAVGVLGASSSGAPTTSGSNRLVVGGWIGIAGVVSTILIMV